MVLFCCVVKCGSRGGRDNVRFFRIPAVLHFKHKPELNDLSRTRREKWINAIKRKDIDEKKLKHFVVCSKHFITGQPAELLDSLNPDWVPSLNMGYTSETTSSAATKQERYNRKRSRIEAMCGESTSKDLHSAEESTNETTEPGTSESNILLESKLVQTEMESTDIVNLKLSLSNSLKAKKLLELRIISYENLLQNNEKCKYYTGLPTKVHLEQLVLMCEPYIKRNENSILSSKDQIVLTLMKLRLNLDYKDLAYRFGISPSTASLYFKNVIHVMCLRLQNLIFWPERNILKKTMPNCFKEAFHENTTTIIDCFEIRTETTDDLLTAAQLWSHYKHSKTLKYLIGITPQGTICYISEGWGGRVSDKCITENSTFLKNLLPGDVVMADRGFLIKEFVELFRATVVTPAFTRGKSQLHPVELEKTRAIAHCRIHVERVIGALRQKFRILSDTIPIVLLSTGGEEPIFDKIVLFAVH